MGAPPGARAGRRPRALGSCLRGAHHHGPRSPNTAEGRAAAGVAYKWTPRGGPFGPPPRSVLRSRSRGALRPSSQFAGRRGEPRVQSDPERSFNWTKPGTDPATRPSATPTGLHDQRPRATWPAQARHRLDVSETASAEGADGALGRHVQMDPEHSSNWTRPDSDPAKGPSGRSPRGLTITAPLRRGRPTHGTVSVSRRPSAHKAVRRGTSRVSAPSAPDDRRPQRE